MHTAGVELAPDPQTLLVVADRALEVLGAAEVAVGLPKDVEARSNASMDAARVAFERALETRLEVGDGLAVSAQGDKRDP